MALESAAIRSRKPCMARLGLQVNGKLRTFKCNRDRHEDGLHRADEVIQTMSVTDDSAEMVEVYLRWQVVG